MWYLLERATERTSRRTFVSRLSEAALTMYSRKGVAGAIRVQDCQPEHYLA
jgi:hypothetical protein